MKTIIVLIFLAACGDNESPEHCGAATPGGPVIACERDDGAAGVCLAPPFSGSRGNTCKPRCATVGSLCGDGEQWATYDQVCYCEMVGGASPPEEIDGP